MTERFFVLFFDASMTTSVERKNYRDFVKYLKSSGYSAIQKSVYLRYTCKNFSFNDEQKRVVANTPSSIQVRLMCLPIGYFDDMCNVNCNKVDFVLRNTVICV